MRIGTLLFIAIFVALSFAVQRCAGIQPADAKPDARRAILVTFGPGPEIWERFGHNALILIDPATPNEVPAFNWGVFDFDQPGFVSRFVQGRMLYEMRPFDTQEMLAFYERTLGRSVILDELDLSGREMARLFEVVRKQDTDANRSYRYDYYKDNCSTRIRDAIDSAVEGRLKLATEKVMTDTTLRWHTRRAVAGMWLFWIGIDLGMGTATDNRLSVWDEMFLPRKLSEHLRATAVTRVDGRNAAISGDVRVLASANVIDEWMTPPVVWPWTLGVGVVLGALLITLAKFNWRRSVHIGVGLWALLCSFACLVLVGFTFTDHWGAHQNASFAQVTPLAMVLLIMVIVSRWRRYAVKVALAVVVTAVLLPLVARSVGSGPILALTLPMHFASAWALWRLHRD